MLWDGLARLVLGPLAHLVGVVVRVGLVLRRARRQTVLVPARREPRGELGLDESDERVLELIRDEVKVGLCDARLGPLDDLDREDAELVGEQVQGL